MRRDLRSVLAVVVLLIAALPAGYGARANPPLMTGDGGARAGFAVLAPPAEADIFDRAPSLDPNGSVSDTVGNESKVYRVTVDVPGELKMRVSGAGPELRARVRAWNADKNPISEFAYAPAAGGAVETTADLGLPGVYYAEVNAADSVPSPQPFTLSLGFTAVPDRFEQNQDTEHAAEVRADETWEAYIFPRLDHDVYTFTVQTAGELTLAAENVPANLRLMSMVYDAQPHEMWAAPQGSEEAGRPFSTTADLPVAGGYYIGVWQAGDTERSLQPIRFRTAFVPAPDPYEPNPEASQAAKVDVNATFDDWIFPRYDHDWFVIEAPSAGQFDVSWDAVAPNLRPFVQFFDDEPHLITEPQAAEKAGEPGTGTVDLPRAGKYYFAFWDTRDSDRSTQPVRLTTHFTPADDSNEPNNDFPQATDVAASGNFYTWIFPRQDRDVFRVTVADPGELVVAWDEVPENLRPSVQFFNDEPHLITDPQSAEKAGQSGKAVGDLPKAGTYYFTVWDTGDPDRSTDPFKLTCTFTPAADAFEPNPDLEHAHPMTATADVPIYVFPRWDHDWFRIDTGGGRFQATWTNVPANLRPGIRFWRADGSALTDPIFAPEPGQSGAVTVTMPATGPWYYSLGDAGDNDRSTSPFELHTRVLSPEPTPTQ